MSEPIATAIHTDEAGPAWEPKRFSSWRMVLRVWLRHRDAFNNIWKTEIPAILGEPVFAVMAIGLGLGFYVGQSLGVPYANFVAPGMAMGYAMFASTFENGYGTYVRMANQKLFDGILLTPVSVNELILGEILWGSTRAMFSGSAVLGVAALLGFVREPEALLVIPVAFLVGLVFSSISVGCTSLVPAVSTLNTYFTLVIAPMFFFGGVFFPPDNLPYGLQLFARVMPLSYATHLARSLALGDWNADMLLDVAVLAGMVAVFLPLSLRLMHRRLVK